MRDWVETRKDVFNWLIKFPWQLRFPQTEQESKQSLIFSSRPYTLVYRAWPLACFGFSCAVTLQRKIRDCSQSRFWVKGQKQAQIGLFRTSPWILCNGGSGGESGDFVSHPHPHPMFQMHPYTQRIFRDLLCALERATQRTNISKYSGTKVYQTVFHVLELSTDL